MSTKLKSNSIEFDNTINVAALDSSKPAGSISYVTDDGGNLFYKNSAGWKSITSPLGSISNPANSASDIINAGDSIGDGFYYIIIKGVTTRVWCDMTNNGGGWMMAARVQNNNNYWQYDHAIWTDSGTVNPTQAYDYNDHIKTTVYTSYAFTQVRLAGGSLSNGLVESGWSGTSFSNFMTYGSNSSNSKATWDTFVATAIGTTTLIQPNCNVIGTNKAYNYQYVKIGCTANNEADCNTNDSAMGFGIKGISPYYSNINSFGAYSAGGRNALAVAWIFLK